MNKALDIIKDIFKEINNFFDMAYKEGWLLYLVVGLIILALYIIFFK